MASISSEDVANILTFLSHHEPLRGSEPIPEIKDLIESGRSALYDFMADCIREEIDREQETLKTLRAEVPA